jgi:cation transport regulator ChaC
MAYYLYSTVKHLEELGLHDKHLWVVAGDGGRADRGRY